MAVEVARVHGLICSNMRDDSGAEDGAGARTDPNFCYDFRFDAAVEIAQAGSPASSPCSTESESDEDDDYIAGLAQQIARSMLEDDDGLDAGSSNKDSAGCAGAETERLKVGASPKSSWSSSTTWSLSSWGSSSAPSSKVSSSQGSSEVSSPPSTPSEAQTDAWDLLYAAAGEVVRLKKSEDRKSSFLGTPSTSNSHQQNQPPPPQPQPFHGNVGNAGSARQQGRHGHRRQQPAHPQLQLPTMSDLSRQASQNHSGNLTFKDGIVSAKAKSTPPYLQRSWSANGRDDDAKLPANQAHYRMVKNAATPVWQRGRSHQAQNHHGGKGSYKGGSNRVSRSAEAAGAQWLGSHVNGGSGMRAVFLSSSGTGRESGGTGVFLPRSTASGPDYRRKPVCSTVLLPSRVVQVLNLNVEDICSLPSLPVQYSIIRDSTASAPTTPSGSSILGSASTDSFRRAGWNQHGFPSQLQPAGAELSLPSEWTY